MAKASLNDIYNRMHGVANYHPFAADTYADWSLEAGDIVTVEREGKSISSPVHTATVRWNGSQKVTLESRGEKERGSIAKMSARAFNSGGNGGAAYRSGYGGRRKTDEQLADLWVESKAIRGYVKNETDTLRTDINIEAGRISAEITDRRNADRELGTNIEAVAGRVSVVVTNNGEVRAGIIVDAINRDSSVQISADKIVLSGNTTINDVFQVTSNVVYVSKPMIVGPNPTDSVYLGADGRLVAERIEVRGGAGANKQLYVSDVTVSGNTLTVTYTDGREPQSFSKAVTLEGAWDGSRKFTVNAFQTNSGVKTKVKDFSTTVVGSIAAGDFTEWDEYWGTADIKAVIGNSETATVIGSVLVNAYDAYQNGRSSVTHSPTADVTPGWTGSISDREYLGSATASSLARTYFLIDAKCSGVTKKYYFTIN